MNRRGSALIEVLVALVILASVGVSTLGHVTAVIDAQQRARSRELLQLNGERVLAATTLLTRHDLDLRLGERAVGAFVVVVTRPQPSLYRIAVAQAAAPAVEDLVTIVFRPDTGLVDP
jgi:hypothetical protein